MAEVELTVCLQQLTVPDVMYKISKENIDVYQTWHCSVFSEVLQIIPPILKADFQSSDRDYIVIPVVINSIVNKMVIGDLDHDLLLRMDGMGTPLQNDPPTTTPSDYENSLVYAKYRDSTLQTGLKELFQVTLDKTVTPLSPFPDARFKNYKEFYSKKYHHEILDDSQPSLR